MPNIRTRAIRSLLFLYSLNILLNSCLGPKKIDKWVAQKYVDPPAPVKKKHDKIVILSNMVYQGTNLSTTEKKTSNMLPLIVYWQFDYKNTCTLNPQIPVNIF